MGFLKNLKAQVESVQAAVAAMAPPETPFYPPEFINPWPQDEVDRLLQGTGTVIRAIVLGKQHQVLEQGERVGAMGVRISVRPRGPEGSLGDEVTLKATMSSLNASLVQAGLDIPVERDATGKLTKVASKQLAAELADRSDEAAKRNPGWGLDPEIEGMIDVAKAVFSPAKTSPPSAPVTDPRRAPVEGTTWEMYVAICADLQLNGAPHGADPVAQKHGVRAYTWAAIESVWKSRIAADPELTALFAADLAAATSR